VNRDGMVSGRGHQLADLSFTEAAHTRGALVFGAGLAVVAVLYLRTRLSRTLLFWVAFVLTRPLGATLGDWLDKPIANGGVPGPPDDYQVHHWLGTLGHGCI
jgi:uncharacterized membrane-anchored protein